MLTVAPFLGFLVLACAPKRSAISGVSIACPAHRPQVSWPIGVAAKPVRVWIAAASDSRDGWAHEGTRRLDSVVDLWRRVGLPLKLVRAQNPREADVLILVARSLPLDSAEIDGKYRAGLTRLTYKDDGVLIKAHIILGEQSPTGAPYSANDQVATLAHEFGHALGLPHSAHPQSLMAAKPLVETITRHDVQLAQATYVRQDCAALAGPLTALRR